MSLISHLPQLPQDLPQPSSNNTTSYISLQTRPSASNILVATHHIGIPPPNLDPPQPPPLQQPIRSLLHLTFLIQHTKIILLLQQILLLLNLLSQTSIKPFRQLLSIKLSLSNSPNSSIHSFPATLSSCNQNAQSWFTTSQNPWFNHLPSS